MLSASASATAMRSTTSSTRAGNSVLQRLLSTLPFILWVRRSPAWSYSTEEDQRALIAARRRLDSLANASTSKGVNTYVEPPHPMMNGGDNSHLAARRPAKSPPATVTSDANALDNYAQSQCIITINNGNGSIGETHAPRQHPACRRAPQPRRQKSWRQCCHALLLRRR